MVGRAGSAGLIGDVLSVISESGTDISDLSSVIYLSRFATRTYYPPVGMGGGCDKAPGPGRGAARHAPEAAGAAGGAVRHHLCVRVRV